MAGKTDYKRAWSEEKLDRIYLTVAKGHKAEIKAVAKARGQSLNKFINEAIDEHIKDISV